MNNFKNKDPLLEMARGEVIGMKSSSPYGNNPDLDAAAEDLHEVGSLYMGGGYAAPSVLSMRSAAPPDVCVVRLKGLTDWDTPEITEDVTLTGTTDVDSTNVFCILHSAEIISGGPNLGEVSIDMGVSTNIAKILSEKVNTHIAAIGIPRGSTGYVSQYFGTILGSVVQCAVKASLMVDADPVEAGGGSSSFAEVHSIGFGVLNGTSKAVHEFKPYRKIIGPAMVKVQLDGSSTAANLVASGGFDIIIERH